ncbi:MAG: AraC family transcriptional regulator [Angelakisella sp.]
METMMSNIDNSNFSAYYTYQQLENSLLLPMQVIMAGDEQCSNTYRIRRSSAEISVLIYVLSGEGVLKIGGECYTLGANTVLTIPQGADYEYCANRTAPWRILWFNITGEIYPYLLQKYSLLSSPVYFSVSDTVVEGFMRGMEICKDNSCAEQTQDRLCTVVYEIILALWRQYQHAAHVIGLAGQLRKFINDGIYSDQTQGFSIADASRLLNVSVRQLERAFSNEYNMTPYQYFQTQKLMLAKQYLTGTALTIKEISHKLGYCDPYYFSNCFKSLEGVSPKAYRNR